MANVSGCSCWSRVSVCLCVWVWLCRPGFCRRLLAWLDAVRCDGALTTSRGQSSRSRGGACSSRLVSSRSLRWPVARKNCSDRSHCFRTLSSTLWARRRACARRQGQSINRSVSSLVFWFWFRLSGAISQSALAWRRGGVWGRRRGRGQISRCDGRCSACRQPCACFCCLQPRALFLFRPFWFFFLFSSGLVFLFLPFHFSFFFFCFLVPFPSLLCRSWLARRARRARLTRRSRRVGAACRPLIRALLRAPAAGQRDHHLTAG
jgi:hypothetical protein